MTLPVPNCSSCAACANVCPRGAIAMKIDEKGFYRPSVDSEKCVECGACERACPWTKNVANPNGASESPKAFAAYATDETIRLNSSSGGIFSVLAEKVLDDGGVVVGVTQLGKAHFGHIVVENKADLEKLRGSKYVQADAGFIYRDVRSLLRAGRKVLFSGTPCQVAALYSVLGTKRFENLTTVDIVCHGSPSVKVFEKYLRETESLENMQIEKCDFRNKSTGWKAYSLLLFGGEYKKVIPHENSRFMRLFLNRICQNEACENCRYRKLPRIADITLGDYWNIASVHPEMDDDKGTSVVLLNTERGEKLFDEISPRIRSCESRLEMAIAGNPCIVRSSAPHPKRAEFFAELDSKSLDELIRKFCPYPGPLKRAYHKARRFLGAVKRRLLRRR